MLASPCTYELYRVRLQGLLISRLTIVGVLLTCSVASCLQDSHGNTDLWRGPYGGGLTTAAADG